ncbi:unnamed protein product [Caenorhabditis brenneri]
MCDKDYRVLAPITPSILRKLFSYYYPLTTVRKIDFKKYMTGSELINDQGLKIITTILKKEWFILDYYGPAENMFTHLQLFRQFPGSQEYMEMLWTEPPDLTVLSYEGPDGQKSIAKECLYREFHWFLWKKLKTDEPEFPRTVVSILLRLYEKRLRSTHEIVLFDSEKEKRLASDFLVLDRLLHESLKTKQYLTHVKFKRSQVDSFSKVYNIFREFFQGFEEEDYEEALKSTIREYMKLNNPIIEMEKFSKMIYITRELIEEFKRIIERDKHSFEPWDEETNPRRDFIVRAFNQGLARSGMLDEIVKENEFFILCSEMKKAIDDQGIASWKLSIFDRDFPQCLACRKLEVDDYPNVVFCRPVVIPTTCRARPIKLPNGEYGVLAYNSLFQIYHDYLLGYRAYPNIREDKAEEFDEKLARILREYYNPMLAKRGHRQANDKKILFRYFITERKEKEITPRVRELCNQYLGDKSWRSPIEKNEHEMLYDFIKKSPTLLAFLDTQLYKRGD